MAAYCASRIQVVRGSPVKTSGVTTLLALNPGRFRGDLEILANQAIASYNFHLMSLPAFTDSPTKTADSPLEREQPEVVTARRESYRCLLRQLLTWLRRWTDFDCVLSAAVHYRQDCDWGVAATQIGRPFLILHRENLVASAGAQQQLLARMAVYRPFEGTQIAVHNEAMRNILIELGLRYG